jgi:hypothetical protein
LSSSIGSVSGGDIGTTGHVHVGDVLRWTEATPGVFSELLLRDGETVLARFRRVYRLGPVVAEGEFRRARWRLEQRGLFPPRYVLVWLDAMEGVAPSTTFVVGPKELRVPGGRVFTTAQSRRDRAGGWRRDDGEFVLEATEHEASMGYFRIASAGGTEPLLPELLITTVQFRGLEAQRQFAEYEGVGGGIQLLITVIGHWLGR